jgi:hypothetical protein
MRKVILYIAMSVDGYIAALNDDLSFLKYGSQRMRRLWLSGVYGNS